MTPNLKIKMVVFLALAFAIKAKAQSVSLGAPSYSGTGCPQSSVLAVLSPDNQALSILFDQFQVRSGGGMPGLHQFRICNLSIPVNVPAGYQAALFQVEYRGFVSVPAGAGVSIYTNASLRDANDKLLSGKELPINLNRLNGPTDQEVLVSGSISKVFTPCGGNFRLTTMVNVIAFTNVHQDEVLASLDSSDITATPAVYRLEWQRCSAPTAPPQPPRPTPPVATPPRTPPPANSGFLDQLCRANPNAPACRARGR